MKSQAELRKEFYASEGRTPVILAREPGHQGMIGTIWLDGSDTTFEPAAEIEYSLEDVEEIARQMQRAIALQEAKDEPA